MNRVKTSEIQSNFHARYLGVKYTGFDRRISIGKFRKPSEKKVTLVTIKKYISRLTKLYLTIPILFANFEVELAKAHNLRF